MGRTVPGPEVLPTCWVSHEWGRPQAGASQGLGTRLGRVGTRFLLREAHMGLEYGPFYKALDLAVFEHMGYSKTCAFCHMATRFDK